MTMAHQVRSASMFKKLTPLYTRRITVARFNDSRGHSMYIKNNGLRTALYTADESAPSRPVGDWMTAYRELFAAGYQKTQHVEKIREGYLYKDSIVAFDHYPGLPPHIETNGLRMHLPAAPQCSALSNDVEYPLHLYWFYYGVSLPLAEISFDSATEKIRGLITKSHDQFDNRLWRQQFWLVGIKHWGDYPGGMISI